jgi:hypothetical protein
MWGGVPAVVPGLVAGGGASGRLPPSFVSVSPRTAEEAEGWESPADFQKRGQECTASMVYNGVLPPTAGGEEMHTAWWRQRLGSVSPPQRPDWTRQRCDGRRPIACPGVEGASDATDR